MEALVTVVIIGIVATVGWAEILRTIETAKGQEAAATLQVIFNAERAYFFDQLPNSYGSLSNLRRGRYFSGSVNTAEWGYAVIRTGSPATAYSAVATRIIGPYANYRRRITESSATQIDTLSPVGDVPLSQSWPPPS